MSSFAEIRSDLLKKYNVSAAGRSSSTTGHSGESEFYTIRKNLLEKYSQEKTEERFRTMNDWVTRFNNVMQGVSDYDRERNGAYTLDASGGYSSEIDSLIHEYDNIKDFAGRLGMPNSQRYVKQLQDLRSSINQINETMSQFNGEEEYNAYLSQYSDDRFADYDSDAAKTGWKSYTDKKTEKNVEEDSRSWFEKAIAMIGGSPDSTLPTATLTQSMNDYRKDTSYREPSDEWGDGLKEAFGYLYARDPEEAWRFAEGVNNDLAAQKNAESCLW